MLEVGNRLLKSVNASAAFIMAQANWASWGCHIRRRAPERAAPPERDASPDRASLRAQPKRRVCTRGEDPEWTGIAGGHWHENKDGSKRWIPHDRKVKLSGPDDTRRGRGPAFQERRARRLAQFGPPPEMAAPERATAAPERATAGTAPAGSASGSAQAEQQAAALLQAQQQVAACAQQLAAQAEAIQRWQQWGWAWYNTANVEKSRWASRSSSSNSNNTGGGGGGQGGGGGGTKPGHGGGTKAGGEA